MKKILAVLLAVSLTVCLSGCCAFKEGVNNFFDSIFGDEDFFGRDADKMAKPVIYLYPEEETEVSVKLDYKGELTCTYPKYNDGWTVTAKPDGTLTDKTGREYSYLFWEGNATVSYDLSHGYVVKGEDTEKFLQETLAEMGLIPKEYNEFIVYWLPLMEKNPYNLITFQKEVYTDCAKLDVSPKPDSLLRVFMAYRPLEAPIEIEAPEIEKFERKGFTAVEWGGTEIKN